MGGNFEISELADMIEKLKNNYPFANSQMLRRLVRLYGTDAFDILGDAKSEKDLGKHFGLDLYESEVCHLMQKEWAMTADDILFRRTKIGIRLAAAGKKSLESWMESKGKAVSIVK